MGHTGRLGGGERPARGRLSMRVALVTGSSSGINGTTLSINGGKYMA
ncbi:hypothetical protein J2W30_004630 [Variovorax boronicumulans]|nr:hypothetical protein [Variovorax boronicumulans]